MVSINNSSSTIETLDKPSSDIIDVTSFNNNNNKHNHFDDQQSSTEPTTIVISSSSSSSEIESTQGSLESVTTNDVVIQPQQQQQQPQQAQLESSSATTSSGTTPMEISDSCRDKIVVDGGNETIILNETHNDEINEYKSKSVETKDKYCWVCHTDDIQFTCKTCPRSYHDRCLGQQEPEPEDINNWICIECERMKQAEEEKKIFSKVNLSQFITMLDNAVKRLKYHGSEPFQKPVDLTKYTNYLDVVVNPMDLSAMEYKINTKKYHSLEEFLNDIKWMLHNASVYHGVHHKLTSIAKSLHRMLKHEISEMEVCPDCYLHSILKRDENWFCEPCKLPHPLVWAKMKGFPYWPGKALRIVNGDVDVRFFGQHDRSWVDSANCFWLSKELPQQKRALTIDGFELSRKELKVHIQRLQEKFGDFVYAPSKRLVVPTEKPFIFIPSLKDQVCIQISIDLSKRGKRNLKGFLNSIDSESNANVSNTESTSIQETKRKKKRRKSRPFSNPKKLKANQQRSQSQKFDISIEDSSSSFGSGEMNGRNRSESKLSNDQITFVSSTESPHDHHDDDNEDSLIDSDNDSDEMDTLEPEQLKLSISNDHNILKTLQTDRIQKQKEIEKQKSTEIKDKNEEVQIIPAAVNSPSPLPSPSTNNTTTTTNATNTSTTTTATTTKLSSPTDAVNLSELLKICKTNLGLQNMNFSKSLVNESNSENSSLNDSVVQPKEIPKIDVKTNNNSESELRNSPINSVKSNGRHNTDAITPTVSSNKTTPITENDRKRFSDVLKSKFRREIEILKKDYEEFRREMKYNYDLTVREIIFENHNNRLKIKKSYDEMIEEVKRKQWCSNCLKEAKYYCCWNTSYCNENCQMAHWALHQNECINTQLDSKVKSN